MVYNDEVRQQYLESCYIRWSEGETMVTLLPEMMKELGWTDWAVVYDMNLWHNRYMK